MFKGRFYQVLAVFIFVNLFLIGRVFYLEVLKGGEYQSLYSLIHHKTEWILAPRGLIQARNGEVLAYNAPGIKLNEFARFYPDPSFSHVIGYIGRVDTHLVSRDASYLPFDLVGKAGIEAQYEEDLRGLKGRVDRPIGASGQTLQKPLITPPKAGNAVALTIDYDMQKTLTALLEAKMIEVKSQGGAAVVLNPSTGAILSLISLPSFNNNEITQKLLLDSARPLFNRAVAGQYPPGSAIKPFLAAAALKENIVSGQTVIQDEGKITIQSVFDPEVRWVFRGWRALGPVDMRKAIAMSSNIYFYTVGGGYGSIEGLGAERIERYLRLFGFGQKTNIDLPGETPAFIPTPEWKKENGLGSWFIGDTYNMSIGQGFLRVTPLQLALGTGAIANGGSLYEPHLRADSPPKIIRANFLDLDKIKVVSEGMRMAVTDGTVWRLRDLPVAVAAKTGTAQAGKDLPPHGWVTLFFPYENPEIVVTILIEHGGGGEQAAVPVAKSFLEWYFTVKPKNQNPNVKSNPND